SPPVLFVRLGELVRVRQDENNRAFIERVTESMLRHRLARVADFTRIRERAEVPADPPPTVVQDLLAWGAWRLPPLESVATVPQLRPDGTVFDTPGYDPTLKLVYCPDAALTIPVIPSEPTQEQLCTARDRLLDLIADFPFVDRASLANMLALMLTP